MEQQKSLQKFIREQAQVQQQLLQKLVSPNTGNINQTQGVGYCKMGPADDSDPFLVIFERVVIGAS